VCLSLRSAKLTAMSVQHRHQRTLSVCTCSQVDDLAFHDNNDDRMVVQATTCESDSGAVQSAQDVVTLVREPRPTASLITYLTSSVKVGSPA
jgi:hypothetical protein